MAIDSQRPSSTRRATRFTAIFTLAGLFWISLTALLAGLFVSDQSQSLFLQAGAGGMLVAASALVLYGLLKQQAASDTRTADVAQLEQFRERVIESTHVWVATLDRAGKLTLWNRAAEQISGYAREEVLGNDTVWTRLFPSEDHCRDVLARFHEVLATGADLHDCETHITTRDGDIRIVSWDAHQLRDEPGKVIGAVVLGRDVTESRRSEYALRQRDQQLATLMANIPGMTYRSLQDHHWTMKFVSEGCRDVTGYEPDDLIGNRVTCLCHMMLEEDRARVRGEVEQRVEADEAFAVEYRIRRRDGQVAWIWDRGRVLEIDGEPVLEGIMLDITDRKAMEAELQQLATRDQLTGLFNRHALDQQLEIELERARRYARPLTLLWLDLDHFKEVNDQFGHLTGDELLQQVAERLQSNLRTVDYVARYGGEEIVVVLPEMPLEEATGTAERLRRLVGESGFDLADQGDLAVTVSIGVAAFPQHGESRGTLYSAADDAMYRAKHDGRNRVCIALAANAPDD